MNTILWFTGLALFSQIASASTGVTYSGSINFQVKTNVRAIQFSGDIDQSQIATADKDLKNIQIKLDSQSFKTGIELRDEHLQEQILGNSPLEFTAEVKCLEENCFAEGIIKINGVETLQRIPIKHKEDFQSINAEFPLSLEELKITTPSYLGVKVQDQVLVNLRLERN